MKIKVKKPHLLCSTKKRKTRHIIFITGSLETESGGRTASIFNRAKLFQEMGYIPHIATFSFKADYQDIFQNLSNKFKIEGIDFLNPYSFYCQNKLYENASLIREDQDSSFTQDDWERLLHVDYKDIYGNFIRAQEYIDPTNKEVYLSAEYDTSMTDYCYTWHRAPKGEPTRFFGTEALLAYWFAQLNAQYDQALFFSENHEHDSALLHNPYSVQALDVVAMVHSTFFSKPYTYGSPINNYLGSVFNQMHLYKAVVTLTEQEREHIYSYYGNRNNIFCIAHPFELPHVDTIEKKPNTIVVCSRLEPLKRIDHIIKAMPKIIERIPDAKLLIYGSGTDEDQLRIITKDLDLEESVEFKGYTSTPAQAIAACSVLVSTSLYEGLCSSNIESLSVGTPVVSYDYLYGPRAYIQDGINGALVPNGDIEALSDAVSDILSNQELLASMSSAATRLDKRFFTPHIRTQWKKLFEFVEHCTCPNVCPLSTKASRKKLPIISTDQALRNACFSSILEVLVPQHDWIKKYVWNNEYVVWETDDLIQGRIALDFHIEELSISLNISVRDSSIIKDLDNLLEQCGLPTNDALNSGKGYKLKTSPMESNSNKDFIASVKEIAVIVQTLINTAQAEH